MNHRSHYHQDNIVTSKQEVQEPSQFATRLLRNSEKIVTHSMQRFQQLSNPRRHMRWVSMALASIALAFALSGTPVQAAPSAAITVGGACTLDDAITNANNDNQSGSVDCAAGSGADTITLTADVTLSAALPEITSNITLDGAGFAIDGNNSYRVLAVTTSSGNLTLNDATLRNGNVRFGAGLWVGSDSQATINNSTISDNSASVFTALREAGGGIFVDSDATVTISGSTISGNSADDEGGGIFAEENSTVSLVNSTISGNVGTDGGGGIHAIFDSTVTLNFTTVTGNSTNGFGGGIFVDAGGFFSGDALLTIGNSIVSGNTSSSGSDREIDNDGTIVNNEGNVLGSSAGTQAQNFEGFTPAASDHDASSNANNNATASIIDTTLADNAGPTLTHAVVQGGPAHDFITPLARSNCNGMAADQRGAPRPGSGFVLACDAGAFELQSPTAIELAAFDAQSQPDGTVLVTWETASEVNHAGFFIYRRAVAREDAEWIQVNEQLVASRGVSGQGDTYQVTDDAVSPGEWEYVLEDVDLDNITKLHVDMSALVEVTTPTSVALSDHSVLPQGGLTLLAQFILLALLTLTLGVARRVWPDNKQG